MSSEPVKPPWARIVWYTNPCRIQSKDLEGGPFCGEWQEDRFEEIEQLKESISPYDKTELWDLAKRITNPYELVSTFSSRLKLPKSICCLHPLSRSFFKMIEILNQLQFFTRHKEAKLKSMHVCEGPGGFIEAFHELAEKNRRLVQVSYGMTLKSTNQMIPGWRRASQFLQRHTNIQLLYGPTRTGNIYEPCNQDECAKVVGKGGVELCTADGGFDFSEDFHAQEKNIVRLLVSSALIMLRCVSHGGDIVLKLFDSNSPFTRDFIALLSCCFTQWTMYKPATSRPCNSEWYFLGKGAVMMHHRAPILAALTTLRDGLAEEPPQQYARILAENFLEDTLKTLQADRSQKQMEALKEVLSFCKNKDATDLDALWDKQRPSSRLWCNAFSMPMMPGA